MNFNSFEPKNGDFASLVDRKGKSDFASLAKKIESTKVEHKEHSAPFNTDSNLKKVTSAKSFKENSKNTEILTNTDEYRAKAQKDYLASATQNNGIEIPKSKDYDTKAQSYEDLDEVDEIEEASVEDDSLDDDDEMIEPCEPKKRYEKFSSSYLKDQKTLSKEELNKKKKNGFMLFIVIAVLWFFLFSILGRTDDDDVNNIIIFIVFACMIIGVLISKFTNKKKR